MNKTTVSSKLLFSLTALLILGNTTIFFPATEKSEGALFGLLICVAIGFALLLFLRNFDVSVLFSTKVKAVVGSLVCLFALACAVATIVDFSLVANRKILNNENYFPFSLLFSFLLFSILKAKRQLIFKLSIIFLIIIVFSQIVLFLMSLNQFNLSNFSGISFSGSLEEGLFIFANSIAPLLLLPFLTEKAKAISKGTFGGMFFGFALIILSLVQIVSIFGFSYSEGLTFPFISVLDTVSLGFKFSRLEGLSYVIFFFGSLTKTAVCLICTKEILSGLFKSGKHLPIFLPLFTFAVALSSSWFENLRNAVCVAICFLAVALVFTLALLKNHIHSQYKTKL